MRVAILLDSSGLGGIETHIVHLARGLMAHGIRSEVVFLKRYGQCHPIESMLKKYQIQYSYLNGSLISLYCWIKKNKEVIIHTHGYKAGCYARLISLISSVVVISTFHNGDKGSGLVRLYTWLDVLTCRLSTNLAVSQEICNRLSRSTQVIPNLIEINEIAMLEPLEKKSIAFVGRLSVEKAPDVFLKLASAIPNQPFVMYGDGVMKSALIEAKSSNVVMKGQVDTMDEHWKNIGLLCITSHQEGLPYTALEAMARGIPIVSFAVGDLPTLITRETGWIIPSRSLKKFQEAINIWINMSVNERRKMANVCRKTIIEHYSYQFVVPCIKKVYQDALDMKK